MSADLERAMERTARQPSHPLDVGALPRRATRLKLQRFVAAGTAVVLLGGGGAFAVANWDRGPRYNTPVVAPADDECEEIDFDLAIYLRDDITDNERGRLMELLGDEPAVENIGEVSKAEAFEEFKRFYEDQPRDALPAFVEVTLTQAASEEDRRRLTTEVRELPGVDGARSAESLEQSRREACAGKTITRYYVHATQPDVQIQQAYISFEVNGTIDVDPERNSVCIQGRFEHMVAAHFVEATPERGVVLQLFEFKDPLGPAQYSSCISIQGDGSLTQRLVDSPEAFRVDFHHQPENSPELESPLLSEPRDVCSAGVPIVEAHPDEAAIGDLVRVTGTCFPEEMRGTREAVFISASTDHDGDVLPPDGSPRDGLPPCGFLAGDRGRMRIADDGTAEGWFIVPSEGVCFQETLDDTLPVRHGYSYWINIGCHTCRYGALRVEASPN